MQHSNFEDMTGFGGRPMTLSALTVPFLTAMRSSIFQMKTRDEIVIRSCLPIGEIDRFCGCSSSGHYRLGLQLVSVTSHDQRCRHGDEMLQTTDVTLPSTTGSTITRGLTTRALVDAQGSTEYEGLSRFNDEGWSEYEGPPIIYEGYLVTNGSERALNDFGEHTFQISSLTGFEVQEISDIGVAHRDKYFGVSSFGITYMYGAASFSGSYFKRNDQYRSLGNSVASYDNYERKSILNVVMIYTRRMPIQRRGQIFVGDNLGKDEIVSESKANPFRQGK
ncbi:ENTH/VHS family protein [Striga asiatica]|uniref:ENTH/VHS family protein n=1 Tax=Striga asiatica TaxID=4170 RepID=A0A5A7P2H9_STRAF|nr:ENTH/VHS family protein [Striga asiatica]